MPPDAVPVTHVRQDGAEPEAQGTSPVQTRQWICTVCGWVYDEAEGDAEHGLAPGTAFADIPDDWYCPECGVTKTDFEPFEN